MRNPLTQVTGPEFLLFFAILIGAVALVCWLRKRSRDTSLSESPLEPVADIDPYEVAYLRGQVNELARVLILRLVETKYLQIPLRSIEQSPDHPPLDPLSPVERTAFEFFATPRTPAEVFGSLPAVLMTHCVRYEHNLRAALLLTTDELKSEANRTAGWGVVVVLLIGITRMIIGISHDKPVAFLVLMGIVGIPVIVWWSRPGRLSRRGRAYLDSVRQKWSWLREGSHGPDWNPTLAAGIFGVGVLAGTEWSPVADTFRRARDTSYTSAGGACGGGGASCGGCGGGCGGGGCGGCGGS